MLTSEFEHRKNIINKYFVNNIKWKYDDNGNYLYYKNPKRCLKELKFMIDIVFEYEFTLIEIREFKNNNHETIGYSVIGSVDVKGDFNGIYQGEGQETEYILYTLCYNGFFYNQSSNLDNLLKNY